MPPLYKYVKPDIGRVILEKRTLRWCTPATLNDPFDMQFAFQLRVDQQRVRALTLNKVWEHYQGSLLDRPINKMGFLLRHIRVASPGMTRNELEQKMGNGVEQSMEAAAGALFQLSASVRRSFANDKILCF